MANAISSKHPLYSNHIADWQLMRDSYKGEREVKTKGILYLPATASHIADGFGTSDKAVGHIAYNAYKMRARYPNFLREAVAAAIGMMHGQPCEIKMPRAMEKVRSSRNETMPQLLRRINTEQLITGRGGLLVDLPSNPGLTGDLPYIAMYPGERIINWDNGAVEELNPQVLNMVVLDETEEVRIDNFAWNKVDKFRVLSLGKLPENEELGMYQQGVFKETEYNAQGLKTISWKGNPFNIIPFTFFNTCDVMPEPDDPALLDLANLCMTIYRGDADYRQNLYMQGQDTFVTIGANLEEGAAVRIGSGARLDLPAGADAKYVGVTSQGLQEQRESLDNLETRAGTMGAQTLDSTSRERESGASMRIRVAARTADLNQIADTGAAALEFSLKQIAVVMGEDPEEVKVTPNKEFGDQTLTGQTMVEMATARNLGFPLSARSMHNVARQRALTTLTFEEEEAEAKKEKTGPFMPPAPPPAPGQNDPKKPGDPKSDPKGNGPPGNNPKPKA